MLDYLTLKNNMNKIDNKDSWVQILHSIFEQQHCRQMDWQKVPKPYKLETDLFNQLSLDEVMFAVAISRWPFDPNKQSAEKLKALPESVQKCVARSQNYLLYNEQFETLYCFAGGKKEKAIKFRKDWNLKSDEARNQIANELSIDGHSLKSIIETLSYDQENHFTCSENYELANEFLNTVRSSSSDANLQSNLLGLGFIHYQGDTISDKRPDITNNLRSSISLTFKDKDHIWVEFNLEKEGIETTHTYNLLDELKIQNDIYFMNPGFYKIRDAHNFLFNSQIVWLIDEEPQHFEFTVRYFGELPTYLSVYEMY